MATRISDATVKARTGRSWQEWFDLLDAEGARELSHQEIVALLHHGHGVGDWWQQMVAVTYEQARKGRAPHQRPDDYQVSASKTVPVPIAALYRAWADERLRAQWLPDARLTVSKATENRSLRLVWGAGASRVEVNFWARGEGRRQVTAQHSKLRDAAEAERFQAYWARALARLAELLERGEG